MNNALEQYFQELVKEPKTSVDSAKSKVKIYFAAPLFTKAEQLFNEGVYWNLKLELLRNGLIDEVNIFLPQEQPINDKNSYADSKMIAKLDAQAVEDSDILIAVLDGQVIDPGVASEIGIAYTLGKPILGLYTDIRRLGADNQGKIDALKEIAENQFHYLNLFTTGLIKLGNGQIYTDERELAKGLVGLIKRGIING